jgi:hypothetical protein
MSDEATTATAETDAVDQQAQDDKRTAEESVPYERFAQANKKAKEAAERAKGLEKQMADLQAQIEEREQAGLPELERLRKDMEKAQKRAEEAEAKAAEADQRVARTQKERWIASAAQAQNFADPSDAAAFLNLDDIDDEKDAERAVKRLAGQKAHLLKGEEPKLPGRVLQNGQPAKAPAQQQGVDVLAEAEMLAQGLKQFASKE